MTEEQLKLRLHDARNALYGLLQYLEKSDDVRVVTALYQYPADRLRSQADAIDRKDAAIQAARDFLSTPDEVPEMTIHNSQTANREEKQ